MAYLSHFSSTWVSLLHHGIPVTLQFNMGQSLTSWHTSHTSVQHGSVSYIMAYQFHFSSTCVSLLHHGIPVPLWFNMGQSLTSWYTSHTLTQHGSVSYIMVYQSHFSSTWVSLLHHGIPVTLQFGKTAKLRPVSKWTSSWWKDRTLSLSNVLSWW